MRRRAILMASVLLASSPAFAGDPVLRAEYLFVGAQSYGLRSGPA